MSDNKKEEKIQDTQQNNQNDDLMKSITAAFNMGVAANQSSAHIKSVTEVAAELGQQIYENFKKAYGKEYKEEFLLANTEYFLQIALLGFIIPSVCSYEEGFKEKLFSLIEAKAKGKATTSDQSTDSSSKGRIIY